MKTENYNPHPILLWHREAAKEIDDNPFTQEAAELAAIIARHDQHQETLRLLERISSLLNEGHQAHMLAKQNYAAEFKDASELIRAHLAAMKGTR